MVRVKMHLRRDRGPYLGFDLDGEVTITDVWEGVNIFSIIFASVFMQKTMFAYIMLIQLCNTL